MGAVYIKDTAFLAPWLQRNERNVQNKHAAAASGRDEICCTLLVDKKRKIKRIYEEIIVLLCGQE